MKGRAVMVKVRMIVWNVVVIMAVVVAYSIAGSAEKNTAAESLVNNGAVAALLEKPKVEQLKNKPLDYIVIVNGERIAISDYISALRRGSQQRFYHAKAPEEEGKKFRKEIAYELVERALLVQEARRQKLQADTVAVAANVAAFDAKFKGNPEWEKARTEVLLRLSEKLKADSLAKVLEEKTRNIASPSDAELKAYYVNNNDLFTTPARIKISLILLRVDPASTSEVWKQAADEAASIWAK
jgi:peptidylprolyl isomerase